jgi:D-beta-D-heptose 7-phosphate kinase / D-beta-D-heptose 1-phosphate adenosyltransferase
MFTTPDRIQALLDNRFGALPVLVVGDLMLDRYLWGDVRRISPEAPVPVVRVSRRSASPGGAGNVALNLATCGLTPVVAGIIGQDEAGAALTSALTDAGIATTGLIASAARPTTTKTRVIGGHQQMLRLDDEHDDALAAADRAALASIVAQLLRDGGFAAVIISDYGKGALDTALCQQVIAASRERGIPVLVDPKGRDWERYRGATTIKPNLSELAELTGIAARDGQALERAGHQVVRDLGLRFLAFSRGADGVSVLTDGIATTIPTQAQEVFDVSGAGDTMVALLAAGLANGLPPTESATLANLGAGIVVGKVGTVPVLLDELRDRFTASQHGCVGKVMTWTQAAERITAWRQAGRAVVFTNGCFDLLHPGHVRLLEQAQAAGDRLVVGLNSDDSVRRLKGPTRPVNSQADRAQVLAALASVDAVVVFDQDTPLELITALRPQILVKGADYQESAIVGAAEVKSWGGRVVRVDLVPGKSSTAMINRSHQT